jgi:hypothetical protein
MAYTRYGFTGPMAAYGTFDPKAEATALFVGTRLLLTGVGFLWWIVSEGRRAWIS